ncbi:MAG: hypothetical protein IRZ08_17040 [Frankia sp.]|nr:hypothetical protein [Frankia sp.]
MGAHRKGRPGRGENSGSRRGVLVPSTAVGAALVFGAASVLYLSDNGQSDGGGQAAMIPEQRAGVLASAPPTPAANGQLSGEARLLSRQAASAGLAVAGQGQRTLPGVGAWAMSLLPPTTRQVVLVQSDGRDSTDNVITLWERADPGGEWFQVGEPISGRNGARGWTLTHREGDQRSPVGVFGLTAAGGRLANPGSLLPYEHRPDFYQSGSGDPADPFSHAFDYVIAIDYNRVPGTPPSDEVRPFGPAAGGDIWLHVDHHTPTRGCVALPADQIVPLLRWLNPAATPMIIMGNTQTLAADQLP